ncbi:hypothetical protein DL96DRAFT_1554996 [Flagelloscypha sp. PMI_526]|nr:hypothetical protein DL96DRAFT_1554996 [Flagelloscypha sp. PMI_526]
MPHDRIIGDASVEDVYAQEVDAVSTVGAYACVYLYAVTNWGNEAYLLHQYWPIHTYVITSGVNGFLVQGYLDMEICTNWIVTGFLALFSTAALVGCLLTVVYLSLHDTYAERALLVPPVTLWLAASTVTDVAIALSLVWTLRAYRTSFKETQSLIKRLTYSAIQTGTFTSLLAIIVLVSYLLDKDTNITIGFGFCLGRAYGCTLLFNLNNRKMGGTEDSTEKSANQYSNSNAQARARHNITQLESLGGIRMFIQAYTQTGSPNLDLTDIHQTAVVRVDDGTIRPKVDSNTLRLDGVSDDDNESIRKPT